MRPTPLPIGKLPPELLVRLLKDHPVRDERVLVGPGSGLDCAVIEMGDRLLVVKSDPVTFASDAIGWYAVQVNANDLATSGARPRWMLVTCLLPPGTSEGDVFSISRQLREACEQLDITLVGGHTEITHGIDHPILAGTMIGEVNRKDLVTPSGAQPGDVILLTKGIPIETVALLAREFPERVRSGLGEKSWREAAGYLKKPGISVLGEAQLATKAGRVSAMHDPTEGGLAAALWELAEASGRRLAFHPENVFISDLAREICALFDLDPLACLASGALLIVAPPADATNIQNAIQAKGIRCDRIGEIQDGNPSVETCIGERQQTLTRPARDEIGKLFN